MNKINANREMLTSNGKLFFPQAGDIIVCYNGRTYICCEPIDYKYIEAYPDAAICTELTEVGNHMNWCSNHGIREDRGYSISHVIPKQPEQTKELGMQLMTAEEARAKCAAYYTNELEKHKELLEEKLNWLINCTNLAAGAGKVMVFKTIKTLPGVVNEELSKIFTEKGYKFEWFNQDHQRQTVVISWVEITE